jgi:hypothetical protein
MDFTGSLNFSSKPETSQTGIPTLISDARRVFGKHPLNNAQDTLLNGRGFLLADSPSRVLDWTDPEEIADKHYNEARLLAQRLLPDFEIWPIKSHTLRNESISEHHWIDGIQYGPCVEFVHNDYADTLSSDNKRIEKTFAEIMGMPTDKRVIGINIWRSVSEDPLERLPLALCDRTSINPNDLKYSLNPEAPKPFNSHSCLPNAEQRWFYYPRQTVEEAIVFTTYDSHPDDGNFFRPTLHTAVTKPGSENLTLRESIEVRFFGFIDLK